MTYDSDYELCSKCGSDCADADECGWIIEQKPIWKQQEADRMWAMEEANNQRLRVLMYPLFEDLAADRPTSEAEK